MISGCKYSRHLSILGGLKPKRFRTVVLVDKISILCHECLCACSSRPPKGSVALRDMYILLQSQCSYSTNVLLSTRHKTVVYFLNVQQCNITLQTVTGILEMNDENIGASLHCMTSLSCGRLSVFSMTSVLCIPSSSCSPQAVGLTKLLNATSYQH